MKINSEGKALIKRWEGLRLKAYPDPASPRARHLAGTGKNDPTLSGEPWTIFYGHTGDVKEGMSGTSHQADVVLDLDLEEFEDIVTRAVTAPLSENQFSALVSILFNVGPGKKGVRDGIVTLKSGQPSTLLRKLNAGDYAGAQAEFIKWNKAGGQSMPGLTARRAAEARLFGTP